MDESRNDQEIAIDIESLSEDLKENMSGDLSEPLENMHTTTSENIVESRNNQEIVVNIESLSVVLKEKMSGDLSMPSMCSIFRIPTILSRHSPTSYTPNQFSVGPFHHKNENLKRTEKIKAKYLRDLLARFPNPDAKLNELNTAIAGVWKEARDYYAGPIGMEADEFVEVLVLDGCFIVELFRKKAYESLQERYDPIFAMSCLQQFLWHDLILLENQVPWLVLEILFKSTITSIDVKEHLVQLAIEYFSTMFSTNVLPIEPLLKKPEQSKHILDLLRDYIVTSHVRTEEKKLGLAKMRSATALEISGIKFKALELGSILDIKFDKKKGILEIPSLFIQETTETVFRNLISLEQCCPYYEAIITSYAVLLDNLIDTREDMEILCKSKAIQTWLNIDDATKFFNKLYIDTYVKELFYAELTEEVNKYSKRPWHAHRRVLMHDYFKHPWALISVIAAAIALILTFLQTTFTIIHA